MNVTKNKRRRFLADRKVQSALGVRIAIHWLIFLAIAICVTAGLRIVTNIEGAGIGSQIALALREQLVSIIVLVALLPWFVHDAMRLSNRVAGPMVRLRASLRDLCHEESTPPIKFRSGDFWLDVSDDYNALRNRVIADRDELLQLRSALSTSSEKYDDAARTAFAEQENQPMAFAHN